MIKLSELKDTHRPKSNKKRVGRGVGSGKGKTCGRGTKGDKARSGYKRRLGNEGGQAPFFTKTPIRGFSRGMHKVKVFSINVQMLEKYFNEGDVVNLASLREKHFLSNKEAPLIKILGYGILTKALTFEVNKISKSAKQKIEELKGQIKLIN